MVKDPNNKEALVTGVNGALGVKGAESPSEASSDANNGEQNPQDDEMWEHVGAAMQQSKERSGSYAERGSNEADLVAESISNDADAYMSNNVAETTESDSVVTDEGTTDVKTNPLASGAATDKTASDRDGTTVTDKDGVHTEKKIKHNDDNTITEETTITNSVTGEVTESSILCDENGNELSGTVDTRNMVDGSSSHSEISTDERGVKTVKATSKNKVGIETTSEYTEEVIDGQVVRTGSKTTGNKTTNYKNTYDAATGAAISSDRTISVGGGPATHVNETVSVQNGNTVIARTVTDAGGNSTVTNITKNSSGKVISSSNVKLDSGGNEVSRKDYTVGSRNKQEIHVTDNSGTDVTYTRKRNNNGTYTVTEDPAGWGPLNAKSYDYKRDSRGNYVDTKGNSLDSKSKSAVDGFNSNFADLGL